MQSRMDEQFAFWSDHPPHEAITITRRHLDKALRDSCSAMSQYAGHYYWRFVYARDFDLAGVEKLIRRDLDGIGWHFLTTADDGDPGVFRGEQVRCFGIAPIMPRTMTVGYHATRVCVIPQILKEGLLPSNAERRATDYPDTEGLIHVCQQLTHKEGEHGSAEWWKETLSKKNNFDDPNWGIIQIDMTQLPTTARVYQDMHSKSGAIVDRIERIPARHITTVRS
jgi:hypothetical protein